MNDFREYSDYLMHYGIRGQKRGIRRYQNEDGSLTEEGKRRYLTNAQGHRLGYTGVYDEQKISEYNNTPVRFWGGSSGKRVYLDNESAYLYTSNKNGQYELNSSWNLSEKGISNFKHDKAVRKAAEILEDLETSWNNFKRGGFYAGKEEDERRSKRRDDIEYKILKTEEKVKSIFKKWGF